jgi:deazaflavin-dependent oxidoreductase (nitroreductase family)
MGLIDQLGFDVPEPNRLQRISGKLASSRPGSWLFARSLHHLDALTLRLSRGRTTVPRLFAGLPVFTLVTTGARSGAPRRTPLVGVPTDGNIAIIGTRFGQQNTPGWYFNLRAHPDAEVIYRGTTARVIAREAEGDARQAIWERACRMYSGYQAYERRITNRPIHIMVLEPQPEAPGR